MSKGARPSCIGLHDENEECEACEWLPECKRMTGAIESDALRGGTHIRLTGKYKERKYKPKRIP